MARLPLLVALLAANLGEERVESFSFVPGVLQQTGYGRETFQEKITPCSVFNRNADVSLKQGGDGGSSYCNMLLFKFNRRASWTSNGAARGSRGSLNAAKTSATETPEYLENKKALKQVC